VAGFPPFIEREGEKLERFAGEIEAAARARERTADHLPGQCLHATRICHGRGDIEWIEPALEKAFDIVADDACQLIGREMHEYARDLRVASEPMMHLYRRARSNRSEGDVVPLHNVRSTGMRRLGAAMYRPTKHDAHSHSRRQFGVPRCATHTVARTAEDACASEFGHLEALKDLRHRNRLAARIRIPRFAGCC
jgi:hypothetical protein